MRPLDDSVVLGDNLDVLRALDAASFRLAYLDPPFGTGTTRRRTTVTTERDEDGDRTGFGGHRYRTHVLAEAAYRDAWDDYLGTLAPRLEQVHRVLDEAGTLYLHLDYRQAHAAKLLLDGIFGPECFLNEIIWAYDYGGRSRRRWPAKHDTILVYVRDPERYHFDAAAVDREPYMAPGLVGPEKAARGKLPTDVWWHTIVPTNGREKTGYPDQKPEGILRRIVLASSAPGDWCLDPFAGSGTLGAVAQATGRRFFLIDANPAAGAVMEARLGVVPAPWPS